MDAYFYTLFFSLTKSFPILIKIFEAITFFGSYRFVVLFILSSFILISLVARANKNRKVKDRKFFLRNFLSLLVTILSTSAVVTILKNIFSRVGPETRILYETDFSFPSAHTAVALALFAITYFLINKNYKLSNFWKNIYFAFTLIFIFLISLSRLILGVHFVSDVVVGVVLGYMGYKLGTIVYKKIK